MQAAARRVGERLGQEGGEQAARRRHGFDDPLEGNEIIRRFERVRVAEIDFVLAGPLLVVRGFRLDAHFLERQADLTADVFRLVQRCDVEIFAVVVRDGGRVPGLVHLEQVELAGGAHRDRIARLARALERLTQHMAAVTLERAAVRILDVAVEADDAALRRAPRQNGQRGRIGEEQQIAVVHVQKAAQRGGVEVDAVLKGAHQLGRHDGDILLVAQNIAEGETDELDVVLLDKL